MLTPRIALVGLVLLVPAELLAAPSGRTPADPQVEAGMLLYSTSSLASRVARETAGPDTFLIYGGSERPLEGKFEDPAGQPDFNRWTPVDVTEIPVYWQVSTFSAANLNDHGPGNHAYWCGQTAAQQPGWAAAPGVGNGWITDLVYESGPVSDPASGQTVGLDFYFNHELEAGFDFFEVAYETPGGWITVYAQDGMNPGPQPDYPTAFAAPGRQFAMVGADPIDYLGGSYVGDQSDRIRIRFRVTTDGGWSDEDGLFDTALGGVQLDDVTVTHRDGIDFEDFEGPAPFLLRPMRAPFAGDFASVLHLLTDLDPCRSNASPAAAFIDFGQDVRNGPGPDGTSSTGGTTSPDVAYGIPGHYIVNPSGGISPENEFVAVDNVIESPYIAWDLPGPDDDGPEFVGMQIRYDVWNDLPNPLLTGRTWAVRSQAASGIWTQWRDRGVIYVSDDPEWVRVSDEAGDLLYWAGPDSIQVRLGVRDISEQFGFGGSTDATPAPVFDNVAIYKYRVGGPAIAMRPVDLAHDGFPDVQGLDVSTVASRDALDIRFDMAGRISAPFGELSALPGDSVTIQVSTLIDGTDLADVRMVWAVKKNPLFEDAIRAAPARVQDENVVTGAESWSGEVVAQPVLGGGINADKWYVDLPDADLIYPGDVVEYYFRATDGDGRVTTLPSDTGGFGGFDGTYDPAFTIHGLPSLLDVAGSQPSLLVIDDGGSGGESEYRQALLELDLHEGVQFDVFRVQAPWAAVSNGIGSYPAHGAHLTHLEGYTRMLYLAGSERRTLSNGDDLPPNDLSDDQGVITAWTQLGGERRIAYFGDSIVESLLTGESTSPGFVADQLGVILESGDVNAAIGGQTAPVVAPIDPGFATGFVAYGGCPVVADFDHIRAAPGAREAHGFVEPGTGEPYPGAAASVLNPRSNGFDLTFPFSFRSIRGVSSRATLSPRALLLREIFGLYSSCPTPCTDAPRSRAIRLGAHPNPFNPSTVIEFIAPPGAEGSLRIFTLRGELVRTLHRGRFDAERFTWDGTDDRGAGVASGVYLVRARAAGETRTAKIALVK